MSECIDVIGLIVVGRGSGPVMTCTFWVAVSKGTVAPEGWLHMDLVENEKLEWTRETPQGTNTSQKVCVCVWGGGLTPEDMNTGMVTGVVMFGVVVRGVTVVMMVVRGEDCGDW